MKIFRFDPEIGKPLGRFGSSHVVLSPVVRPTGQVQIGCFHMAPGGIIGYHQATVPQLFLVVQGEGWVRGEASDRTPITVGRAAFWERGEWHEAGTDAGMVAIVIESEELDPAQFMVEL